MTLQTVITLFNAKAGADRREVFFPTVIDADVRGGRLEVEMHDLWRRRIFGQYSFSGRSE